MNRHTLLPLLLPAWLWACSPAVSPSPAPPAPSSSASTRWTPADAEGDAGNACREQVANLEDWLKELEAAGQPVTLSQLDDGADLVRRNGAPIAEAAPLLHIKRQQMLLDGVLVDSESGVQHGLAKLIELRSGMTPKSPFLDAPLCHIAVDQDAPWSAVASALSQAVEAGITRVTFVFNNPSGQLPSIPPSVIDPDIERLRAASPTKRQQVVAELLAYVYQDCPEGLKVIAKMGASELADFKQVMLAELPSAIEACGCAPKTASVKALHWEVFGQPYPIAGVNVQLPTKKAPARTTILLAPEVQWSTASTSLDGIVKEGMQPVHFGVLDSPLLDNTADGKVENKGAIPQMPSSTSCQSDADCKKGTRCCFSGIGVRGCRAAPNGACPKLP